ncbi:MAG: hypothetical protein ACTSO9_15130 [Candidatus Helarchaeota archaeon]
MKLAVSNSGPLIHLAKAGLLELLKIYDVSIPSEVKIEVVDEGKKKGYSDAILIEEAIKDGWIRIIEIQVEKNFLQAADIAGLHHAEIKTIYYAFQKGIIALLDDDSARVFARTLGVKISGSLGVLIKGLKEKKISYREALKGLDDLADVMYLSSEIYKLTLKELKKYE